MSDDAERFAVIDALRVRPISGRISNKRTADGSRRYVRAIGNGAMAIAACGCEHIYVKAGNVCPVCGGAELTDEERVQ
jgi:hypothetical protein